MRASKQRKSEKRRISEEQIKLKRERKKQRKLERAEKII